jgi:PiT family inorganic phosphate transporter
VFSAVSPGSTLALALLVACFVLVLAFEISNGFHDTANAVATVIYTNSLKPTVAVVWSGLMNFIGVLVGGIAVAYALVGILPPEVLSPPDGDPAVAMLAALFLSALIWNVGTWLLGIPNSSSHALIGSLIGISVASVLKRHGSFAEGVDWGQIVKVLEALLISPVLGFVGAWLLYRLIRLTIKDAHLYEPPAGDQPPVWWMRGVLILTCTGVSFAHGTNDGQKSIGLIMLTIIGLAPLTFALNQNLDPAKMPQLVEQFRQAGRSIDAAGGSEKAAGVAAATDAARRLQGRSGLADVPERERIALRADTNRVLAALKTVAQDQGDRASKAAQAEAKGLEKPLTEVVNYAPWWVRILSAACLGIGTMIGYKRIVTTLGERLGKQPLVPAQGGAAELVSAVVIGIAGFTGGPVSTTHVVTSGIAGTMVGSGAGVQPKTLWQIAAAWVLTLPCTIVLSGLLFAALA